jgi:hypothetical protein
MLCPKTWVLKRTKSPGIESPPNSTKNLGSNRNPSIGGRIRSLGDQDQCDAPGFQLASLALMAESTESNQVTLVKARSTWVITSKTSLINLLNPLTKSTHPRGQPLVRDKVKPRLNTDVGECLLELLPCSPNFT